MDLQKLDNFLNTLNLPKYRRRQILKNYFSGRYSKFSDMTDIPLDLRNNLDKTVGLLSLSVDKILNSDDSSKSLLKLNDGLKIETVMMRYSGWVTACISSQVGCPLNCSFCATGKMGFKRNLTSEEIIDQVIFWNQQLKPEYVGRVVYMGMGEPFLNWDNFLSSLNMLRSPDGLNIGSRKISVSTAGIVDRIYDFAKLNIEVNLAVSLHSAVEKTRLSLMPIAKKYPLHELQKSLQFYTHTTNRQVFFEYALIDGANDTTHEIISLINWLKSDRLFFLNLIQLNPIGGDLKPSPKLSLVKKMLDDSRIEYTLRQPIGRSIDSACGQLSVKE